MELLIYFISGAIGFAYLLHFIIFRILPQLDLRIGLGFIILIFILGCVSLKAQPLGTDLLSFKRDDYMSLTKDNIEKKFSEAGLKWTTREITSPPPIDTTYKVYEAYLPMFQDHTVQVGVFFAEGSEEKLCEAMHITLYTNDSRSCLEQEYWLDFFSSEGKRIKLIREGYAVYITGSYFTGRKFDERIDGTRQITYLLKRN